ncbi:MAG: hypothetical protein U0172_12085 [Nitrospiraceae bacterium]
MNGSRATSARHNVATVGLAALLVMSLYSAQTFAAAKPDSIPPQSDVPDEDLLEFLGEWTVDKGQWHDPLKEEAWSLDAPSAPAAPTARSQMPAVGTSPRPRTPEASPSSPFPDSRNRSARP